MDWTARFFLVLNGIVLALLTITHLRLRAGRAFHTLGPISTDCTRNSVLVDDQHGLFHCSYSERCNCSKQQLRISFCCKPVGSGHGKPGVVSVNKVVYWKLRLTPHGAMKMPLVLWLRLFGVAFARTSHCVNLCTRDCKAFVVIIITFPTKAVGS